MAVTSTERVKRYRARKRELKAEITALFPEYPIIKEIREKLEALGYRQVIAWAKPEENGAPHANWFEPEDEEDWETEEFNAESAPVISYVPAKCLGCRSDCEGGKSDVKNFNEWPFPKFRKWVWLRLYHRQDLETGCELGMRVEALIRHILPEPDDEELRKWRRP